ncbi:MAG: hypothetical protein ACOC8F_04675, partial [Planctomycetota bacterium]
MDTAPPNRARGFTLAESLLAAAVLAMTVAALTLPFSAAARNAQVGTRRALATALAEDLMEEILAKPFLDPDEPGEPGPDSGEPSREHFDNIDDYHGYVESAGEITTSTGEAVTDDGADGLSRDVTAEYVYVSGQDSASDPDFIRVTVRVARAGDPLVTLTRLVHSLEGPYDPDGDDDSGGTPGGGGAGGEGDDDDDDDDDDDGDDDDDDDD